MTRRIVVWAGVLAALFAVGWWVGRSSATAPSDLYQNLDVFVEVLQKVQQNYVDAVEPQALIDAATRGMLRDLDPFSQFLDPRSWDNLKAATQGSFGGIGIVVTVRDNFPTVISPIEGGPAWTLGLRPGDMIVKIDGQSSAGLQVEEVANRLRGPAGSRVTITVRGEGEPEDRDYEITREIIVTRSVPYAFVLEGRTGYLRLANFSENSGSEVRAAMARLESQGASRLVLDLRANPGGLLDQAVDVVEQFVKPGTLVVFTRGRSKGQDNRYYSAEKHPQLSWPLVVLVNEGSASASEIVAGTLQDLDRALVVGENSFGKGSVQSVYPLRGRDAALKLTTALYYTPSGRSIHRAANDRPLTRVSASPEGLEDQAGDDEIPVPARPDTTPPPMFRTAAGRMVQGGGGVRPDVVVAPDSMPPVVRRLETRALPLRFANRWVNAHRAGSAGAAGESPWNAFVDFLRSENVDFRAEEFERERPALDRALRRELARRSGGDGAAARVALEGDPVFARAVEILSRSRSPREVFTVADASARASGR